MLMVLGGIFQVPYYANIIFAVVQLTDFSTDIKRGVTTS